MSVSHPRYLNLRGSLPAHTPQSYFEMMNGKALTTDEIMALCAERGITDARIERGQVVAKARYWTTRLETAQQVERLAAERAEMVGG